MQNPTANQQEIIIVLLCLFIFGAIYAWFVRRLRNRKRDHGQTAWLVVCGDAAIAFAFTLLYGVDAGVVLLLCMTAAGLPMIIEYIDDHLALAAQAKQRSLFTAIIDEDVSCHTNHSQAATNGAPRSHKDAH